jgi:hypothetical protein
MIDSRRHDPPGINLPSVGFLDPRLDTDDQAVVPRWSHNPEEMLVDQPDYEVKKVPLTSISLVTSRTIKVKRRSALTTTVESRELTRICVQPYGTR